jgi:hypothetical protein
LDKHPGAFIAPEYSSTIEVAIVCDELKIIWGDPLLIIV